MMENEINYKKMDNVSSEYKFINNGKTVNFEEIVRNRLNNDILEGMRKYMPIGSVITIDGSDKLIMIIGFNYFKDEITYDYIGCLYPFGINMNNSQIIFNHSQIDRVYYLGFINNQERIFKTEIDNFGSDGRNSLK